MIVGQRLRKHFRRKTKEIVQALDDVSFEIAAGSLSALVGPDGGGKTTLIRLMAGLLGADAGELSVLGVDPAADRRRSRTRSATCPSGSASTTT